MNCRSTNPAARRYFLRFAGTMAAYCVCIVVSVTAVVHFHPAGVLAYALAVLPSLPIVGMLAVFALYLDEEKDDFQRTVMVQSILWSTGATLAATTIWGFLENFVHVPHLQLILIFPLYCAFWGIATPFVLRRYR